MNIRIEKPSEEKLKDMGVKSWSIWEKGPSEFDWHYSDSERCYILEGEATVKTPDEEVTFGKGDMVLFPAGLSCTWKIKSRIRKHYRFE